MWASQVKVEVGHRAAPTPTNPQGKKKKKLWLSWLRINLQAVKLALSTLPTLINWHLPATPVPPLASHMLYDKKIRPLNEQRRGDRKSSRWRRRYSEGGCFGWLGQRRKVKFGPRDEKTQKSELGTFYFYTSPGRFAGHHAIKLIQLMYLVLGRWIRLSTTNLRRNEEKLIFPKTALF